MSRQEYALRYAAKGWPVLPVHSVADGCCTCDSKTCRSAAKHPITINGVKDAATDPDVILRWMAETHGMANIGIATGNGLLVLDIDAKKDGFTSLAALEGRFGNLPLTPTVSTGGGGKHFYFSHPKSMVVSNRAAIMPGVDIRGDGGYVVAPPSIHASGQPYCWDADDSTPLAPAPPWLLEATNSQIQQQGHAGIHTATATTFRVQQSAQDFSDAPGVGEGERNSRLCQLTGIHLARGEAADAVEVLAKVWAKRCEPPVDDDEVERTVRSLAAKHATSTVVPRPSDEIDAIPLPKTAPWPVLDTAALHGFVGETVNLIAPQTESDPAAILVSTLICLGNCFGRKVWFPVEGDRHYPNLFGCIVGDSSRGRKGTSLGRTLALWPENDPWRVKCIASGLSSGEGLKWAVRDPVEVTEPIKEKGKVTGYQVVIKDPGVDDKRLLVVESEFAQALKVAQREGNTLSPVVRQAWDTGTLRTLTRNDPTTATDAHISILGHITRQELAKYLTETDCSNGFANRFLWILAKRSKLLPDGGAPIDLSALQRRLSTILEKTAGCMSRSPAAAQLWRELYPILTTDRPGLWGKTTSRGEAQTLRLSMIYAIVDGTTVIDVPHLDAAVAVWRYAEASARVIFTEEERMDPLERSLLEKITKSPGINRKSLHKQLGGHVHAEAMVKGLGKLAALNKVRSEMVPTGGRPSECWWPVQDSVPTPAVITPLPPTPVADDASERTKSADATAAAATVESPASSFARSASVSGESVENGGIEDCNAGVLPLPELLTTVRNLGGRIAWKAARDGFIVQNVDDSRLTPAVLAAIETYREDLALLVPLPRAVVQPTPLSEKEIRHAEWLKGYEAEQAKRIAREEELRNSELLTDEEFLEIFRDVGKSPM